MIVSRLLLIVAILGTVSCDRVTKRWAVESLADGEVHTYLGGTVRLEYAENTGAFLSLGASWPPHVRTVVFTAGAGAGLLLLTWFASTAVLPPLTILGVALIVAGGGCNVAVRIATGVVVDFLNVGVGLLRTGIFNVADVAITAGAALAVVSLAKRPG